jgi:hypothetical protein
MGRHQSQQIKFFQTRRAKSSRRLAGSRLPESNAVILRRRVRCAAQTFTMVVCLVAGCHRGTAMPSTASSGVTYSNADYGLTFLLPNDWRGYTVLLQQWESRRYNPKSDSVVFDGNGPIIILRHPLWKATATRQDIPILVFTRAQWDAGQPEGIYAGGIAEEISHNTRYVFAVSSRFNTDDSVEGSEEAGAIVQRNASRSAHLPLQFDAEQHGFNRSHHADKTAQPAPFNPPSRSGSVRVSRRDRFRRD